MDLAENSISGKLHPRSGVFLWSDFRLETLVFLVSNEVVEEVHQHQGVAVLVVIQDKAQLIEQQPGLDSRAVILARFVQL